MDEPQEETPLHQTGAYKPTALFEAYAKSRIKQRTINSDTLEEIRRAFVGGLAACLHNIEIIGQLPPEVADAILETFAKELNEEIEREIAEDKQKADEKEVKRIVLSSSLPTPRKRR